jgi:hypothetical protein
MSTASSQEERGAALILVLVTMVLLGLLSGGVATLLTSSLNGRAPLQSQRNAEYASDGAIEYAIAAERMIPGAGPAITSCTSNLPTNGLVSLFGLQIHLDCVDRLSFDLTQRDVIFSACLSSNAPGGTCSSVKVIIRADVFFDTTANDVRGTQIRSWSVNG